MNSSNFMRFGWRILSKFFTKLGLSCGSCFVFNLRATSSCPFADSAKYTEVPEKSFQPFDVRNTDTDNISQKGFK